MKSKTAGFVIGSKESVIAPAFEAYRSMRAAQGKVIEQYGPERWAFFAGALFFVQCSEAPISSEVWAGITAVAGREFADFIESEEGASFSVEIPTMPPTSGREQ